MWTKEEIGLVIKNTRLTAGLTQAQVAKALGRPQQTIANWEVGRSQPDANTLFELFKLLGADLNTSFGFFPGRKNAPLYSSEAMKLAADYDELDEHGRRVIRIVADEELSRHEADRQARDAALFRNSRQEMEIAAEIEPDDRKAIDLMFDEEKTAAGSGYQLIEERMQVWKVLYNDLTRKADFCIEVDGQSMEPMIEDGDIILIRQQPSVDVGEIGLFTVNDKGYVKKQGTDRLISINKKFEDIIPGEFDTVFCRGKVIGILDPAWIIER